MKEGMSSPMVFEDAPRSGRRAVKLKRLLAMQQEREECHSSDIQLPLKEHFSFQHQSKGDKKV